MNTTRFARLSRRGAVPSPRSECIIASLPRATLGFARTIRGPDRTCAHQQTAIQRDQTLVRPEAQGTRASRSLPARNPSLKASPRIAGVEDPLPSTPTDAQGGGGS
jgi:hypothetical protein